MTHADELATFNTWSTRAGLVLLAPLALLSHLLVAIGLAVKVWAGKVAEARRSA